MFISKLAKAIVKHLNKVPLSSSAFWLHSANGPLLLQADKLSITTDWIGIDQIYVHTGENCIDLFSKKDLKYIFKNVEKLIERIKVYKVLKQL